MSKKKGLFAGLFGKKKDNDCCDAELAEDTDKTCNDGCCSESNTENTETAATVESGGKTIIKVVGSGCPKCNKLTENVTKAADELGLDYQIIKVTDLMEIAETGIMQTPGLIINDKIVVTGKVPGVNKLKEMLEE